MPATVPKWRKQEGNTQQPSFTNPLYSMLADVLQQRIPGLDVYEVPGRKPGQSARLEIAPQLTRTQPGLAGQPVTYGTYPGKPMTFEAEFGAPSPIGMNRGGQQVPMSERSIVMTTPSRERYVLGASGVGQMEQGVPRFNFYSPVENLANIITGALGMAAKPDAGTPNQLLEWGMTHQAPSYNMTGGALRLAQDQLNTQAPGMYASRMTMMLNYQRGVPGSFDVGQTLQNAMVTGINRPQPMTGWERIQNYMVIDRIGDTFRLKPAGDIEMYATPGAPATVSMGRASEEKRFGIKTSSSMGTRMNLTPMQRGWNEELGQQVFMPMSAESILEGNTWRNLPQYAQLNATFGGEYGLGGLPKQPQQRLTSLTMIAPTTFPGAAIINPETYNDIYGFGYTKPFRIGLGEGPIEQLLSNEGGLQLANTLAPGVMYRAGRNFNRTIGYFGTSTNRAGETVPKPIRLGLNTSDFVVGQDEGAISLMIPTLYRQQDYGGLRTGESTGDLMATLQQRFPGVNIVDNPDISEPTLRILGKYITGASGKGEAEMKFGFKRGEIQPMQIGGQTITPTIITGESKSLPATLMSAFALQPYAQQMQMLSMVDPRLATAAQEAYPYSGQGKSPTLDIQDLAAELTALRAPKAGARAGVDYPITTPINMFTEMLGQFMGATEEQNAANISRFGIGRTGNQWITSNISAETYGLYQNVINQTLQEMHPGITQEQMQKMTAEKFQFEQQQSGAYKMRQLTSGMIMPTILPTSEEWLGRFVGNFEVMASTQQLFPNFAKEMGLAPEQGPLGPNTSRATTSWAEAFKLEAYRQDRIQGNVVQPPGSAAIDQRAAKTIMDRISGKITNDTPAEQVISTLQSTIEDVVPGAKGAKSLWFPGMQEAILAPETFAGVTSVKNGQDITQMTGVYGRAMQQVLGAEFAGDRGLLSKGSFNAYQTSLNRTLSGRRAKSALRRIYGRENDMAFSARYEPMPELGLNEMFVPNQVLRQLGLNMREINNIKGDIPLVAGRYPTLSRGGGVAGMRLVTEQELKQRNIAMPPQPPSGSRKGDPFAWNTVYVAEAFSRGQHGDWDRDLLFAMLGLKPGTRTETTEVGGQQVSREVPTWNPVHTSDIMANINLPMNERMAQYENMMKVMEPYTTQLDVLKGAVRNIFENPFDEATKTSRLIGSKVQPGISMERVQEAAFLTNVTASSGKGRSYNVRRWMEAALTAEGGRGEEEITMGYDTSAYMFQQYLDILRTKKEGFTPLEEAIGTVNINTRGRTTAKQASDEETGFVPIVRSGRYDLGPLAFNAGLDPSLSNEFLSVMFGQGTSGAKGIRDVIGNSPITKNIGGKIVPDENALDVRAQMMQDIANDWEKTGMIGPKSPIASILTVSAIERARMSRDKEKWGSVQNAVLPWMGQEQEVQDIIKDPMYRKMRTGYRALVRKLGVPSASDIGLLAEGGDLPLNRLARGLAQGVLRFPEAQAMAQWQAGIRDVNQPMLVNQAIGNLAGGVIKAHASEVYKASMNATDYNNDPLAQIAARTAFGKDILTTDAEVFGRGEQAEEAIARIKDNRLRRSLGIHLGGREEESALNLQIDRMNVQGNPDFFALTGNAKDSALTPLFSEVKSTKSEYFNAIKARLAGKSTGSQAGDEAMDERLREFRAQTQFYEEGYNRSLSDLRLAEANYVGAQTPENKKALDEAKSKMSAIAEKLVPRSKGEGPSDVTRNMWRSRVAAGETSEAQSQLVLANYNTGEVMTIGPKQFSQYDVDIFGAAQNVQDRIGTAQSMAQVMGRISNLPLSRPGAPGAHTQQPFGISSALPPAQTQTYRGASRQMAEDLSGGLPMNFIPMPPDPQAQAAQAAAVNQAMAGTPSTPTGGQSANIPPTGGVSGTPAGTPPSGNQPPGNIPPTPAPPAGTPAGKFPKRAVSAQSASRALSKALGQVTSLEGLEDTETRLTRAVNDVLGRDTATPVDAQSMIAAITKDMEGVALGLGPEGMAQLNKITQANKGLETAFNTASGVIGPRNPVRKKLADFASSAKGRTVDKLDLFGSMITQWKNSGIQGMEASAIASVMGRSDIGEFASRLSDIGIDIFNPRALEGGITDEQRQAIVQASQAVQHGLGGIKKVAPMLKTAGAEVPVETSIAVQNLSAIVKKVPGIKTKAPELEQIVTPEMAAEMAAQAGKVQEAFKKLTETTDKLTDAKGKERKAALDSADVAKAQFNLESVRYKRTTLGAEIGRLKGIQQPLPEEIERMQQVGAQYESTLGTEKQAKQELKEAQQPGGGRRFASAARQLLGGWGLFYMRHLATLGVAEWQAAYGTEEQFTESAQRAGVSQFGTGLGVRPSNAQMLARNQVVQGGGAFRAYERLQAQVAGTPIADIGGAVMQGLGGGMLMAYAAPALETMFGAAAGSLSKFAGPVGLVAGATSLIANRWANATDPYLASRLGAQTLQMRDQGFNVPSVGNFMWNAMWGNLGAGDTGMQYAGLSTAYTQGNFPGMAQATKMMKQTGGDTLGLIRTMATDEKIFKNINPDIAAQVSAEVLAAGINNPQIATQIATARQMGVDTSAMARGYFQVVQGGYASGARRLPMEAYLGTLPEPDREKFAAGVDFLGNVPYSQQFTKYLQGSLSREDLRKARPGGGTMIGMMHGEGGYVPLYADTFSAEDRQRSAVMKAGELQNRPLGGEIVQAWSSYVGGQQLGLNTQMIDINKFAAADTLSAQERVAFNRMQLMNQAMMGASATLQSSTMLSQPVMSNLINQMAPGGLGAMNFLSMIGNKDPQALAMASYQTGSYRQRPELISVDLNRQGRATGLPLYTSNMFDFQAQQIWGANYAEGQGGAYRAGAVEGVQGPYGTLYGMRALQWQQQQKQWEYTQQNLAIQGSGLALQRQYMPQFWALEDQQRQLGYKQQYWEFGRQEQQLGIQARQFGQQQGLQWAGMQENRRFAQQQWGYQDMTRQLQWGWRVEDYQEQSRFMTGRDRRLAERQMGRETIMYGLETEQISKEREHQKEVFRLEEEGFQMQKRHFAENQKFQEEGIKKQREFFEERKKLEEEMIKLQREYQKAQMGLSEQSYALQKKQAEEMHQMEIDYQQVQKMQDDIVGAFNTASKFEIDFADSTLTALEASKQIYDIWNNILNSSADTSGVAGAGGGSGPTLKNALGGWVDPGERHLVGETQAEVFVPQRSGTIIPMSKLRNPWGDTIGSKPIGFSDQGSPKQLVAHISIGNHYLGKFIVSTIEQEMKN